MSVGCGMWNVEWAILLSLGRAQLAPLSHVVGLLLQGADPLGAAIVDGGQGALVVGGQDGGIEELLQRLHIAAMEVHLQEE